MPIPNPTTIDALSGRPLDPFSVTQPVTHAVNPASPIDLYVSHSVSGDTTSWTFVDATGASIATTTTTGLNFTPALAVAAAALITAGKDKLNVLNVYSKFNGGPLFQGQLGDALR